MAFAISREQQKVFVEHFVDQVLTVALDLVDKGTDKGSPGATMHAVGRAVIREIHGMDALPRERKDLDA